MESFERAIKQATADNIVLGAAAIAVNVNGDTIYEHAFGRRSVVESGRLNDSKLSLRSQLS